ncbi:MAG: phage protease [Desulfobulbus sp.]|nr:phage protease [Desulfobulbus sp.]
MPGAPAGKVAGMDQRFSSATTPPVALAAPAVDVTAGRGFFPVAACALSVQADQGFIRLIPAGRFEAPRGALAGEGPWFLTADGAARIVAAQAARTSDLLIDYEHQSLLASENGKPVPAAGWIDPRSLVFRADGAAPGLYGQIRWTAAAAALIAADEYRYLSPTFFYDASTGEVTGLQSVALTNDPAIDESVRAALKARAFSPTPDAGDCSMEFKKQLLAALGLAETANDEAALAAVAALKARADNGDSELAAAKAGAESAQAELAALKASADPAKTVPVEAAQQMQAQIAALSRQIETSEREALIAANAGKIPGALIEWARTQPIGALKAFIEKAPDIAALSGMQSGGKAPGGGGGPSADELAICKAMGLSAEQFKKAGKEC